MMLVGIKPLYFTGSGTSETIDITAPQDLLLSAQAALILSQQRIASATSNDVARWQAQSQQWRLELEMRKIQYRMIPPAGTLISGGGLSV
jgi:hypothetical protein